MAVPGPVLLGDLVDTGVPSTLCRLQPQPRSQLCSQARPGPAASSGCCLRRAAAAGPSTFGCDPFGAGLAAALPLGPAPLATPEQSAAPSWSEGDGEGAGSRAGSRGGTPAEGAEGLSGVAWARRWTEDDDDDDGCANRVAQLEMSEVLPSRRRRRETDV